MLDPSLLVARVTEVHGTKIRAHVFGDKNEAYLFHHGDLVRNVSVGGFVKIPCGFDQIIGRIEGEIQSEQPGAIDDASSRTMGGASIDRIIEISVFGVKRGDKFDRGITILPLVSSDVYVLAPEELALISSFMKPMERPFELGTLVGQENVPVVAPTSALFASHIGIFGNTGSGKSNTLCKFYSDCFDRMRETGVLKTGSSQFIIIDFNGEYVGKNVLCPEKKVYVLDTAAKAGEDKIPVPKDFYFDLETWAILTQATEKTQRPFLRSSLRTAEKIATVENGKAYVAKMVKSFLEGYYGHEHSLAEQREDFVRCMALLVDKDNLKDAEEKVRGTVEDIEIYTHNRPSPVLRIGGTFGDSAAKLVNDVFELFNDIPKKPTKLIADLPALVEFAVRFQFLQRWRAGSVAREHISSLIPRLESQMNEARKLHETVPGESLVSVKYPVKVFSLLNANQEQKKLVPLIIAKYAYREQRTRGRKNPESSVHLIVDEAHNILSYSSQRESESWRDYRLETFEEIVKEGRKFGMYLTVSSQRPSDISPTIISQMHNYFIHRLVNDDDLNAIGKAVSFIDRSTSSMIPVLPQGACIASGTAIPYPTQLQVGHMPTNRQPHSYDRDLAAAWGF